MCFLLRLVAHSKFSQVPTLKFLPIFDAFWLLLSFRLGCVCWKSLCQKHLQSKCNFMQIRCRCCCWTRMHLTAQVNTKLDWIMHWHSCVYLVNGNLQEALEAYPVIACQKYLLLTQFELCVGTNWSINGWELAITMWVCVCWQFQHRIA